MRGAQTTSSTQMLWVASQFASHRTRTKLAYLFRRSRRATCPARSSWFHWPRISQLLSRRFLVHQSSSSRTSCSLCLGSSQKPLLSRRENRETFLCPLPSLLVRQNLSALSNR